MSVVEQNSSCAAPALPARHPRGAQPPASAPDTRLNPRAPDSLTLSRYDPRFAADIVGWIAAPHELTWLAPGTPPPLTEAKVAAWGQDRPNRHLLWTGDHPRPAAYAELNRMPDREDQYWIGHFIVSPACRGRAIGRRFAQALLTRAFLEWSATEVLLVVFPGNSRAIRCYEQAGLRMLGQERKYFKTTRRRFDFLRMGIQRPEFIRLIHTGALPAMPLAIVRLEDASAPDWCRSGVQG